MCLSCKSKRVWSFVQNRMTGFPIKFDHNEVQQLRKKFKKISSNKQQIDKQSFQQNMGILGLKSAYGFSDRLFNSFDIDKDGKISFQDFLQYMEVLKSGSQKHKAKISFRLIDIKNKDKVDINDFKEFLDDYFRSWTSITNSIITPEIKDRTDQYVNFIFRKVRKDTKKNVIDFLYYAEKLYCDKDFTEAFEFITEGVANMFISDRIKDSDDSLILHKVLKQINILYASLTDDIRIKTLDSVKMKKTFHNLDSGTQKAEDLPDFMEEQFPGSIPFHNPKFCPDNTSYLGKDKTGKTQEATRTHNHWTQQIQRECKNCMKADLLEKKIEYIMSKLKYIVDETKQVYERLNQKYITNRHSNLKKQTIGNIHVHRPNTSEGNMIFFGDDNWNLVLNMMIGIQMAVRSVRGYQEMIYEQPKDFNLKYYFELVPRRFGNQEYISQICSFTDYAPQTFNNIRKIFNIDNEQYIQSIGPNKLMASLMMGQVNSMTSLTSQGKSGSFFYYTADGKYMLKTIQYREYKFFRNILEDYYYYIKKNPQTMITKFFGLHKLIEKDNNGDIVNKSYFVIMANVFNTKDKIVERYDIKGSWFGRQNLDPHPNATKKDNDFKKRKPIELAFEQRQNLMKIIRKDAQFFRKLNIIDYSLLIGVIRKTQGNKFETQKNMCSRMANGSDVDQYFRQTRFFEDTGTNQSYIFGIIDILTEYSTRKTMEYYFKRTFYGEGISAVPPDEYSERFVNFIDNTVYKKLSPSKVFKMGNQMQVISVKSQMMMEDE